MSNLIGKKIYLKNLFVQNITEDYISWMNDYEIVKYTESRFSPHNRESIEQFVNNANNANNILFGIFTIDSGTHIGNIKLGAINWIHRYADIGLIIGNKNYWGKGIATEAISLVSDYAFTQLNLHKLTAGAYEFNEGSIKAFIKNGFSDVFVEKEKYFFEGKYINCVHLEKFNDRR